jgi:hypothetical protein
MPSRRFFRHLLLTAGVSLALSSTPALASNDAYEALKLAAKADEETNAAAGADVAKKVDQSLAQLGTPALSAGKFEVQDKLGDFAWRTIGRIQYDAALFDNDKAAAQNDAG